MAPPGPRPPATGVAVLRAAARGPRGAALAPRGGSVSGANFRRSEVARRRGAMSGDSSGRRPEGRGRGREPHRERTRSRSRSRSRSPLSRRGAAPERREAPERPSLEETEPSDSGDEAVDPASLEAETDHGLCRQIRHQYRALINSVQRKRGAGRCGAQALRGRAAPRALGLRGRRRLPREDGPECADPTRVPAVGGVAPGGSGDGGVGDGLLGRRSKAARGAAPLGAGWREPVPFNVHGARRARSPFS